MAQLCVRRTGRKAYGLDKAVSEAALSVCCNQRYLPSLKRDAIGEKENSRRRDPERNRGAQKNRAQCRRCVSGPRFGNARPFWPRTSERPGYHLRFGENRRRVSS